VTGLTVFLIAGINTLLGSKKAFIIISRTQGKPLIAKKVENREAFDLYHNLGLDYFQEYFFCRPEIIFLRVFEPSSLAIIQTKRNFESICMYERTV
jgi:c-di-GMP-related signal transduction protein